MAYFAVKGEFMKPARKGTKRRPTYKPRALVEQAASLHIRGASNRAIAKQLGVKPHTVPHMLDDSEVLREYRKQLAKRVPKALENVDMLLTPGQGQTVEELGRTTRWLLEGTQIAVKKIEEDFTRHDDLAERTDEELEFYAKHGKWPSSSGKTSAGRS